MADFDYQDPQKIYDCAIRFLARREHGLRELQLKIVSKGFEPRLVTEQLQRIVEQKLQSDSRYAEAVLREQHLRGKGPLYIRAYLKHKGIRSADIDSAFTQQDFDWFELARQVRVKKLPVIDPKDLKTKQRCYRHLAQRGFDSEQIAYAMGSD